MPKKIAGKTFYTPEEAAAAGIEPPTEEERAKAHELLDEFQAKIDALPNDRPKKAVSPKFYDDTSGTEFDRRRPPRR
jgi:hypothetical protein